MPPSGDRRASSGAGHDPAAAVTRRISSRRPTTPACSGSTRADSIVSIPRCRRGPRASRPISQRARITAAIAVGFTRFGTYALAKSRRGDRRSARAPPKSARCWRVPRSTCWISIPPCRIGCARSACTRSATSCVCRPTGIRSRLGAAADALSSACRRLAFRAARARARRRRPRAHGRLRRARIQHRTPDLHRQAPDRCARRAARASAGHAVAALSLAIDARRSDDARPNACSRPRRPSTPRELLTLVRLRLDACRFSAGLVALRITADAVLAAPGARRLFPLEGRRDTDAANQAFARLRAEFGERRGRARATRIAHICRARSSPGSRSWPCRSRSTPSRRGRRVRSCGASSRGPLKCTRIKST